MNTKLQMTRRWIPALLLVLGLMIQTSAAQAQSRGRSSGRESNTERTERKSTPSTEQKATPQGRSQSSSSGSRSSRQPAAQPQSRSSSGSRTQQSRQQGSSSRASNSRASNSSSSRSSQSREQASSSSRGSSSRASSSREGNSRSQSSTRSTATRGSSGSSASREGNSRSQSSTRSTATRGSSGSSASGAGSSRAGSSRESNSRSQSSTRSTATRGSSDSSSRAGASRESNNRASQSRGTSTRNTSVSNRNNGRGSNNASGGRAETRGRTNTGSQGASRGTVRVDGRRNNSVRRDATGVRVLPAPDYGWRDARNHRVYQNRKWRYKNNRVYVNPVYHRRPHVQINVVWPWQNRYRRNWRPSYRYSQVVYVESGWHGSYHRAQIDIRTNYHHEVRYADHNKAVVDIYLDEIEVYENGYYLGKVRRFPRDLEHIEATIYRNGDVVYDRDVFIVGNPRVGFELIATRHYDGYVMDYYDRSHGLDVGRLNFRRKRVDSRRYSRLFDPYNYKGFTPISVLPDDEQLLDYGYDAISYHHYDDNYDPYYGGSYDDVYYDYDNRGGYSVFDAPGGYNRSQFTGEIYAEAQPLTLNRTQEYNTKLGVAVKLKREATLERLK